MNLERAYPAWFVACSIAGALIGKAMGQGAIEGLMTGMLFAASPILLLGLVHVAQAFWRPVLPPCRCGRCNHRQYRLEAPVPGDAAAGGAPLRFRCPKCDRRYVISPGRFDELPSEGPVIPYMRHTKWGRWELS